MGTGVGAGQTAPLVLGLNITAAPDGLAAVGDTFGATGAATFTLIGPVVAGANVVIFSPTVGVSVTDKVGSTDGTATGSFTYTHTYADLANPGRQIMNVSWTSGSTTLTAAVGTFLATDVGTAADPTFVASAAANGISPTSVITAVAADGSSATISVATTAAAGPVTIGTGHSLTFVDPAFATGAADFTTNGIPGGNANIGITEVDSATFLLLGDALPVPFGGTPGTGTASITTCLLTGFDAALNPGPAQFGQSAPLLPAGTTTPLLAVSGGFISQPNTTPKITPPPAAHATLAGVVVTTLPPTTAPPTTAPPTTAPPTTAPPTTAPPTTAPPTTAPPTTAPPTTAPPTTAPPTTAPPTTAPPTTAPPTTAPPTTAPPTTAPPTTAPPTTAPPTTAPPTTAPPTTAPPTTAPPTTAPPTTTPPGFPTTKADCKHGGWKTFGFKNQGQCIKFVNHLNKAAKSKHHGASVHARLIDYVRPQSEGGVALLALFVGMGLFGIGMLLPTRRRRS